MQYGLFWVSLKVILKNQKNEVLGLEAQLNGSIPGFYDLPGGRVDNHEVREPFPKLIDRELKEEVGNIEYKLNPKPVFAQTWDVKDGKLVAYVYYEAEYLSGDIIISNEHLSSKWIPLSPETIEQHFTSFHKNALQECIK